MEVISGKIEAKNPYKITRKDKTPHVYVLYRGKENIHSEIVFTIY